MSPSKGIVITGATGFLGRYVVEAFRRDRPETPLLALGGPSDVGHALDLGDAGSVCAALTGFDFDVVVHLAAQSSVAQSTAAPAAAWRANVLGTLNLAEAVYALSPHATLIHAGTAEAYGTSFLSGRPLDEEAPLRPTNAYARGKVAAEMALQDSRPADGRLILLRLFNHTGPGQDERFVAPSFAAQIARAEREQDPQPIRVGNLSARRDFGDVEDAVRAIVRLVDARDSLPAVSTFNVCSGVSRPVSDVLDALLALARKPIPVEIDGDRLRPSDIAVAAGSYSALETAVGWKPAGEFEGLMAKLLDYWRMKV